MRLVDIHHVDETHSADVFIYLRSFKNYVSGFYR